MKKQLQQRKKTKKFKGDTSMEKLNIDITLKKPENKNSGVIKAYVQKIIKEKEVKKNV